MVTIRSYPPIDVVIRVGISVFLSPLLRVIAAILNPTIPAYIGIYCLPA